MNEIFEIVGLQALVAQCSSTLVLEGGWEIDNMVGGGLVVGEKKKGGKPHLQLFTKPPSIDDATEQAGASCYRKY